MTRKRRPDLTEAVKDNLVRDYLKGDKTIILQMEYKISPGEIYRILKKRGIHLRSAPLPEPITDPGRQLPEGNTYKQAIWDLTMETWTWKMGDTFDKLGKVMVDWLEKDPISVLTALEIFDQPFRPEDLVNRSMEMHIGFIIDHAVEIERVGPDSYRLRNY